MSQVPIDEVVHFDVVTHNPSTGAVSDADATPTYSVFEEDTDTPILGPTNLTKRTSLTGNYRGSFTCSADNGFESGRWYSVIASATVNGVAGKTVVANFRATPAESAAGVPKVDVSHVAGTSQTAGDIIGDTNDIQSRLPAALVGGRMDASVGAMAADTLTASAVAASAVAEIQAGLSTLDAAGVRAAVGLASANLDTQIDALPTNAELNARTLASADYATAAALAAVDDFVDTEVAAIKAVTDKLDTALELDVSVYRFTTNALEQAPAGGGGTSDWTADERTAIRAILGIPAVGTAPDDPTTGILDTIRDNAVAIKAKTDNLPTDPADASVIAGRFDTLDTAVSAVPTATENADELLARDIGSGAGAGSLNERTVRAALRFLRNKWTLSGTTLTVTKEDDLSTAWTAVVTTAAGADPISGSDPT